MKTLFRYGRAAALLIFLQFLFSSALLAQAATHDVVYLKNGSVIKGEIIEQVPNQSIKIKTADGNIFVYKTDEIDRISREAVPVQPIGMTRRGFCMGIRLDPAVTDVYIDQYKKSITPNVKFLGGISLGGYVSDHVGFMSGLRIEQYGSTFKNVPIGYTTYYSYPYGYYTSVVYGDAKLTMTYLAIPILVTCMTSKPGNPGFYFEVGPEAGILLSSKETVSGSLNGTTDATSGIKSFQLIGHLMLGAHIPILNERMSIKVGPYVNAGILNLYASGNTTNGNSADNAAIGLSVCVEYTAAPHK